jgi:hypothetical protein
MNGSGRKNDLQRRQTIIIYVFLFLPKKVTNQKKFALLLFASECRRFLPYKVTNLSLKFKVKKNCQADEHRKKERSDIEWTNTESFF